MIGGTSANIAYPIPKITSDYCNKEIERKKMIGLPCGMCMTPTVNPAIRSAIKSVLILYRDNHENIGKTLRKILFAFTFSIGFEQTACFSFVLS